VLTEWIGGHDYFSGNISASGSPMAVDGQATEAGQPPAEEYSQRIHEEDMGDIDDDNADPEAQLYDEMNDDSDSYKDSDAHDSGDDDGRLEFEGSKATSDGGSPRGEHFFLSSHVPDR
jgi:hypothetical protein